MALKFSGQSSGSIECRLTAFIGMKRVKGYLLQTAKTADFFGVCQHNAASYGHYSCIIGKEGLHICGLHLSDHVVP
jgi:hypothetical protein